MESGDGSSAGADDHALQFKGLKVSTDSNSRYAEQLAQPGHRQLLTFLQ